MKLKRRVKKANKSLMLTYSMLTLLLFLGIGYSILSTNLKINGTLQILKPRCKVDNKLYNVIECETKENGLAAKYTGNHNDTLDNSGDQDIYYFTGDVRDKFNVKLDNMCFQMLRTTDTGGVKLIYNGEYDETNKCNDSRGKHKGLEAQYSVYETLDQPYVYGDSYLYDLTSGNFTLQNTFTSTWSDSTAESLIGKYTCKTTESTCTKLCEINGYKDDTTAYAQSYTIKDTEYSQIGATAFNANYGSPAMAGYMFNKVYNYKTNSISISGLLMGNDVKYENGEYTLLPAEGETELGTTKDNTHHYSCNNTSDTCSTVKYYYADSYYYSYYIELTGGTKIEDAINEMLYADNVNTKNSNIKALIETWYKQNMTSYTNKLEDVVYCNDRSQVNEDTSGWNKNGKLSKAMRFKSENGTDLSCTNTTDQFTVANSKAKLEYPIGLPTLPEMNLLNNNNSRKAAGSYWLSTPKFFSAEDAVNGFVSGSDGDIDSRWVSALYSVRPAISLKPGTEFSDGDGSMNNPYVVKLD